MRRFRCPKCYTEFHDPDPAKKFESGILCQECKRLGFTVVGVIHPEEVTDRREILEEIARRIYALDWCIGYELTQEQHIELDAIKDLTSSIQSMEKKRVY